ncbi:hypothetical protein [Streptomyces mirabilis]
MTTPSTRTGVVIPHHGPGKVHPLVDVRRDSESPSCPASAGLETMTA